MTYEIKKSNNSLGAYVEDGTTNVKFDITLIGKNYAGYGIPQNENFLHLLENFANGSAPTNAINGQLWYDNSKKQLNVNTGTAEAKDWHTLGILQSSDSEPTNLSLGNFWWNTTYGHLYCKTVSGKEFIGGSSNGRPTLMRVRTVKDDASVDHEIIEAVVGTQTVFTINNGAAFTLKNDVGNIITGFTSIKPGITINNLNQTTNTSSGSFKFWGSATDSDSLGGVLAANYISTTNPYFADNGLTIGNGTSKKLWLYNDAVVGSTSLGFPVIENKISEKIIFKTKASNIVKVALEINGADILPGTVNTSNIGGSSNKFDKVYAQAFKGVADGADTLKVGLVYASATDAVSSGSIVARTSAASTYLKVSQVDTGTSFISSAKAVVTGSVQFKVKDVTGTDLVGTFVGTVVAGDETITLTSGTTALFDVGFEIVQTNVSGGQLGSLPIPAGSIRANYFVGIATASGGDVAEKYLADDIYDIGSVLMIGGKKEITAATYGNRAIGAISVNPSIIMNNELQDGTLVGLKGRVPVKVVGKVKKGDHLIAADTGVATVLQNPLDSWLVFAIALEDNSNETIKIIESVIL